MQFKTTGCVIDIEVRRETQHLIVKLPHLVSIEGTNLYILQVTDIQNNTSNLKIYLAQSKPTD